MKKYTSLLLLVSLIIIGNANSNELCDNKLPVQAKYMTGKWQLINNNEKFVMHFKEDGSFIGDVFVDNNNVMHTEGMWIVRNNNLNWLHLKSNIKSLEGERDRDLVVELKCDSMLLKNRAKDYTLYKRI